MGKVGLVIVAALLGTPATGHPAPVAPPVIVDPPGDANGLNAFVIEEGPDTRPASDDRADILAIWPQTTHETIKERDEEGEIIAVRHIPRALRVNVRTLAPARPATGPTLMFRLPVHAEGCFFELRFRVHGPLSGPDDPPETPDLGDMPPDGTTVSTGGGCFGGNIQSPEFEIGTGGDVTWAEFPFDAFTGTPAEGVIAPGVEMGPNGRPYFWALRSQLVPPLGVWTLTVGGPIDVAHPLPDPFIIGSDVPSDIDCRETPEEPPCKEDP